MHINVGVMIGTADCKTKKQMKQELIENPKNVIFYTTSYYTEMGTINGTELEEGVKYSAVGPNAHYDRKWYATVEKINGKIKVS